MDNLRKLDVGCGVNKRSGCVGVDLDRKPCVDVMADACHLPFKDGAFSEVYSSRCIQHVKDNVEAFAELRRVCNGKVTVVLASWRGWLFYKLRWMLQRKRYGIFHLYSMRGLQRYGKVTTLNTGFLHKDYKVEAAQMQVLDVGSGDRPLTGEALHIDLERDCAIDVLADGYRLPFADNAFSVVHCSHTLEHVLNPYAFLQELNRVAKHAVVVKVPNASHYRHFANSPNHIYGWTKFNFKALLQLVFPTVQVQENYRPRGQWFGKFKTYVTSVFFGCNELTAVCYKKRENKKEW